MTDLTVSYDRNVVLDAVSFDVYAGDRICIVGENGSGKTTLIKALCGLVTGRGGKIRMENGLQPTQIGYLPQQTKVQRNFPASVGEVVLSGCVNKTKGFFYTKALKERAGEAMHNLFIADLVNTPYCCLSGGQQQRVLLARALCATEKLLILDEPTSGLDANISSEFYVMIKKLSEEKGLTVLMVSHDMREVLSWATKILHIKTKVQYFGDSQGYAQATFGACR